MRTDFTERQIEIIEATARRIDGHGIQDLTIKTLAADLYLSEAALYRHFKSKNEILHGLLLYFKMQMHQRLEGVISDDKINPSEQLKLLFDSQLKAFVKKPSVISVIFSESIFQFEKKLSQTVIAIMETMQNNIEEIVKRGQAQGVFTKFTTPATTTTIIMGTMRMVVLKWKLSGHKSDLVKDGDKVLCGLLKMLEK